MHKVQTAKLWLVILGIIGLAAYLNIGWAMGTYFYDNVDSPQAQTTMSAKILAGPEGWVSRDSHKTKMQRQVVFSILWPLAICAIIGMWVLWTIGYIFVLFLWLIFAGGIAKLTGIG